MSDRIALARAIAARTKPRFIEIPRELGGGNVPFTEERMTQMCGGLTPKNSVEANTAAWAFRPRGLVFC